MEGTRRPSWRDERGRNGGIDRITTDHAPGQLWLCGKHLIGPDHERAIERVDAALVVCLNEVHELADRYPGYVAWLRSGDPRAHWLPVPDMTAPALDVAVSLVERVQHHLGSGQSVLVHCGAGIGRAGTAAAAVLVDAGHHPGDAIDIVAACRPMAGPEAGQQRELLDQLHRRQRTAIEETPAG